MPSSEEVSHMQESLDSFQKLKMKRLESIRKMGQAQALFGDISMNICETCTYESMTKDMSRMEDLNHLQQSLFQMTYKSMAEEVELHSTDSLPTSLNEKKRKLLSCDGTRDSIEMKSGEKGNHNPKRICTNSCDTNIRTVYDVKKFQVHTSSFKSFFSNMVVREDKRYDLDGLVIATLRQSTKNFTKEIMAGNIDTIDTVTFVQRNATYQYYRIPGFHYNSHWSYPIEKWKDFSLAFPSSSVNTLANDVPVHHMKNGGVVYNHTSDSSDPKVHAMCDDFRSVLDDLVPVFDLSMSKSRKTPSVAFGFTDNNPNEYKKNRIFICGKKKKPNLMTTSTNKLKKNTLRRIAVLMASVIKLIDPNIASTVEQDEEGLPPYTSSFFRDEFAKSMDFTPKCPEYEDLIRYLINHGASIILNSRVAGHEDGGNPSDPDKDQTYSLNCIVPVTQKMWKCKSFSKILKKMGIDEDDEKAELSAALMIYKKKCVVDFVRSWKEMVSTARVSSIDNPVQKYLFDILSSVDSEHNYNNVFYDRKRRIEIAKAAKYSTHDQPCFSGKFYRSPEALDRTAMYSCLVDEIISFGIDYDLHFTKADIIGTALFFAGETDGILLMVGCMEFLRRMYANQPGKFQVYHQKYTMYSLWTIAQRKLWETRKANGYTPDVWGHSECQRFSLPNRDARSDASNNPFQKNEIHSVIDDVWSLCEGLREQSTTLISQFNEKIDKMSSSQGAKQSIAEERAMLKEKESVIVEEFMENLTKTVRDDHSKKGFGPFCALNTFQFLAIFNIVPMHLGLYATMKQDLGGHNFCKTIADQDYGIKKVSIETARKWVKKAVTNLQEIIGIELHDLIVENSMCILSRWHTKTKGTMRKVKVMSRCVDPFVVHENRGLQNFFCIAINDNGDCVLEMVPGTPNSMNINSPQSKKGKHDISCDVIEVTSWGGENDKIRWSVVPDDPTDPYAQVYESQLEVHEAIYPAYENNNINE